MRSKPPPLSALVAEALRAYLADHADKPADPN